LPENAKWSKPGRPEWGNTNSSYTSLNVPALSRLFSEWFSADCYQIIPDFPKMAGGLNNTSSISRT
jgi:hypothetical protein